MASKKIFGPPFFIAKIKGKACRVEKGKIFILGMAWRYSCVTSALDCSHPAGHIFQVQLVTLTEIVVQLISPDTGWRNNLDPGPIAHQHTFSIAGFEQMFLPEPTFKTARARKLWRAAAGIKDE